MKILQKIPYKLKTALPALALAGASLMSSSCDDKEKDLRHDVELEWFQEYYDEVRPSNIRQQLEDPTVRNVYLKYINKGRAFHPKGIHPSLIPYLDELLSIDPKRVFGRGNFQWPAGACQPADSLWLVSKGWTVNTPPAKNDNWWWLDMKAPQTTQQKQR